jgi:hypothetical protein
MRGLDFDPLRFTGEGRQGPHEQDRDRQQQGCQALKKNMKPYNSGRLIAEVFPQSTFVARGAPSDATSAGL